MHVKGAQLCFPYFTGPPAGSGQSLRRAAEDAGVSVVTETDKRSHRGQSEADLRV